MPNILGPFYYSEMKPTVKLIYMSCPTLCNPVDYSLPESSVHGIFQARTHGLCFILQRIFPTQGWSLHLLMSSALAGGFFTTSATWEAPTYLHTSLKEFFFFCSHNFCNSHVWM